MLNLFQMPLHMTWISLVNRLSYNYDISPAMLTEGLFWFRDLSVPDPYCVLPVLGGVINILNMLNTSVNNSSTIMRRMRKYLFVMPLLSIPV